MRNKGITVLLIAIASIIASCSSPKTATVQTENTVDATARKAVGDRIFRIITDAEKVEVNSLTAQADSLLTSPVKKIPGKELALMKFIATNPKNYQSNKPLYGVFKPQFQAVYKLKKAQVTLRYDFGLKKWAIYDAAGVKVKMFDLRSDNMLRLAASEYPENEFFKDLLLNE